MNCTVQRIVNQSEISHRQILHHSMNCYDNKRRRRRDVGQKVGVFGTLNNYLTSPLLFAFIYLSVSPSSGSNERYKSLPILPRHVIDAANRFRLCGGIVMSIIFIYLAMQYANAIYSVSKRNEEQ